jgi:signal transduction histidine kinase
MRLLPRSLFGRLLLLLMVGLSVAQLLGAAIQLRDRDQALYQAIGFNIAQRVAAIVELLDDLSEPERRRIVAALDLPPTRLSLDQLWREVSPADGERAVWFQRLLRRQLGADRPLRVEIADFAPDPDWRPHWRRDPQRSRDARPEPRRHRMHAMGLRDFVVQVGLRDGAVVTFRHHLPEEALSWPYRMLAALLVLFLSVAALAALAVRALIRPLRVLADAAGELGRDIRRPPLAESGPLEVQRAARAFNTMQRRLIRYIEDRDRILAAVSHDLKTPITRLRLRTELLEDSPLRDKFQADLDEMQRMTQASLDFLRGDDNTEALAAVDLDALLECLQEEAEDTGREVRIVGSARRPLRCRLSMLKRCLNNLLENALKYGRCAEISVTDGSERLTLIVRDRGPGIPETELERVFEPFYRLEGSRSRDTGGAGLGLSIARNIARAHGGELRLRNHPDGGLEAVLELPR